GVPRCCRIVRAALKEGHLEQVVGGVVVGVTAGHPEPAARAVHRTVGPVAIAPVDGGGEAAALSPGLGSVKEATSTLLSGTPAAALTGARCRSGVGSSIRAVPDAVTGGPPCRAATVTSRR